MNKEVDLEKYQLRTDLAIDEVEEKESLKGVKYKVKNINNIKITDVTLSKNNELNRKKGKYITLEFEDVTDRDNRDNVTNVLTKILRNILKVKQNSLGLIVGLGNDKSTPDSLGPLVINNIVVTNHIYLLDNLSEGYNRVAAINPGVMGQTGIETSDIIESIVNKIKPDYLVVIDSLASKSIERLNKTIQITDTGIHPGSGVGNNRKELSKKTLGIPVIAIGVPTVVSSSIIVNDTLNYLFKHLSYIKDNKETNKLIIKRNNRYKDKIKDRDLSQEEKNNLLGLVGSLDNDTKKRLMEEVLTSINANLIVTSTEIDFLIDKLSNLISSALNNSLHRQITHY